MFKTFERTILTKSFVTTGELPSISHIDDEKLKNHILKNKNNLQRVSENPFEPYYLYHKQIFTKELTWFVEYILQNWNTAYQTSLELFECVFLIQEPNQFIRTHHHQLAPNQKDNPDISVLYPVSLGKEKTRIFYNYDNHRFKNCSYSYELKQRNFHIFNSDLTHYIEQNNNDEPNIFLSVHYQIVNGEYTKEKQDIESIYI
jgi:hypothetical protein